MSIKINLKYQPYTQDIPAHMSSPESYELVLESYSEEMGVVVKDFPSFLKSFLSANLALIRASINLNMLAKRLVVDVDPLLIKDIDSMTLGELDIGQNKTFNSI